MKIRNIQWESVKNSMRVQNGLRNNRNYRLASEGIISRGRKRTPTQLNKDIRFHSATGAVGGLLHRKIVDPSKDWNPAPIYPTSLAMQRYVASFSDPRQLHRCPTISGRVMRCLLLPYPLVQGANRIRLLCACNKRRFT